jgi:predicted transposase/invertase (TIGR01784 family)
MQEYFGLLRRKYAMPVKQFVIYLGQKASRMQTALTPDEIFEGFSLQSLRDYSYANLLASDIPEEIILAILTDFKDKKPEDIIRSILFKLREISGEEITLRKYIKQLSVLARLRNLTRDTYKQIKDMGLTYDITNDYLYQEGVTKGIEKGIEKGMEKGIEKGMEKGKKEMIIRMLKDKTLSADKIAGFAQVSVDYVKAVARELKKN